MKRLPLGPLYYEFSRHIEPRLRIEPGETIVVESEDAFSGQVRTNEDRRDKSKKPYGNPQTGPIYMEGAQAGDSLAGTLSGEKPAVGPWAARASDPQTTAERPGAQGPHG